MTSITFRAGRTAPHPESTHPRLRLTLTSGDVVAAPETADWLSRVPSYPMYANDRVGDCTIAAAGHLVQAWTGYASTEFTMSDQDVLSAYEAITGYDPTTGSNDTGANMQDVCGYWRSTGIGGHKILGFAQIDHTNINEVHAAIAAFGGLYVGVNFPAGAMNEFNAGSPWTVIPGDNVEGGHAIHVGKYDHGTLTCVTWGKMQGLDENWWNTYAEEAWVIITKDWIQANGNTPAGESVAALGEQFTALTGEPSPFGPVSRAS